jgi:resuscitation-promoting factor RpfA
MAVGLARRQLACAGYLPMRLRRIVDIAATSGIVAGLALVPAGTASAAPARTWDRIAACESGGDWHIATGKYRGGLQFSMETWRSHGGKGDPEDASREEQIRVAERVLRDQGWGAWPVCSRKAGVR